MDNKAERIEDLYGSLSDKSKETILLYTKLIAAGEANARNANNKEQVQDAAAR